MDEKPTYEFWFFKEGDIKDDLNVHVGSALELFDRFVSWKFYEQFCGLAHGYDGRRHYGWHNSERFPRGKGADDAEFDVDRLHDLEYVEQMVAELWARVAGGS